MEDLGGGENFLQKVFPSPKPPPFSKTPNRGRLGFFQSDYFLLRVRLERKNGNSKPHFEKTKAGSFLISYLLFDVKKGARYRKQY